MSGLRSVSVAEFAAGFNPANGTLGRIRVDFNWGKLLHERWPIEGVRVPIPTAAGRFFLSWYLGRDGRYVRHDEDGAKPVSLAHIRSDVDKLPPDITTAIGRYRTAFLSPTGPGVIHVATYRLPENRMLVMDGCHRLAALVLSGLACTVTTWDVAGPISRECLADLRHWDGERGEGTG